MVRSVVLVALVGAIVGCASGGPATSEGKRRITQPSYTCAEVLDALRHTGLYVNELEARNPSPRPRNQISDAEVSMSSRAENQLIEFHRRNC